MKKQEVAVRLAALVVIIASVAGARSAQAALMNVDQLIFEPAAGLDSTKLSGTVDMSFDAGLKRLTILLRNTSSADAVGVGFNNPASLLLTGVGFQMPGVDISGGTITVYGGSSAVNFDAGQDPVNLVNQWGYANASMDAYTGIPSVPVDSIVSSKKLFGTTTSTGDVRAQSASGPPPNLGGPGYGAISSALLGAFGNTQPGVNDTIQLVLQLTETVSVEDINRGNVVLAFGSPTAVVPEPTTITAGALLLLPFGLSTLRKLRKARTANG
jgi:hypothetical protein